MIYNGVSGYNRGNLNLPVGTVLATTKGPTKGKNWFATANASYSIAISSGASGKVALQGTNDVTYRSATDDRVTIEADLLPSEGATWTDIQAATSSSATGSVSAAYAFLRLVITTSGTGIVTQAFVNWS